MNKDNTFQYIRQIMLVMVCSVVICATIATIVITQTRKDYASLEYVEEGLALAHSSLANAIQQQAKAMDEKIATLQKAIESLETPQTTATSESTQTDEIFYSDSVPCCGGDEQVNSPEDSSEPASAQNADEEITEEEVAELMAKAAELKAELMDEIENDAAEADLFRSMLDEEELAHLNTKITENQSDFEEIFRPLLELIPGPYSAEEQENIGFINAILANVAEQTAIADLEIEKESERESAVPLEERIILIPPENPTEEEMEEFERIQQETRRFMRMLEESARE